MERLYKKSFTLFTSFTPFTLFTLFTLFTVKGVNGSKCFPFTLTRPILKPKRAIVNGVNGVNENAQNIILKKPKTSALLVLIMNKTRLAKGIQGIAAISATNQGKKTGKKGPGCKILER